jgi:glutamyl-tRNA synthetase/glutamyl-Q tRNA(Asp) synthetase
VEEFEDARIGLQRQDPEQQCGDVLLRDRNGNWTYQFAVTVDDWRQGVDTVIRGIDLLPSTGRQIRLARLLGRERPPTFFHHPLIMKTADQKVSKSDGDTGVRDLRSKGWSPGDVIGAARRLQNIDA